MIHPTPRWHLWRDCASRLHRWYGIAKPWVAVSTPKCTTSAAVLAAMLAPLASAVPLIPPNPWPGPNLGYGGQAFPATLLPQPSGPSGFGEAAYPAYPAYPSFYAPSPLAGGITEATYPPPIQVQTPTPVSEPGSLSIVASGFAAYIAGMLVRGAWRGGVVYRKDTPRPYAHKYHVPSAGTV